MAGLRYLLVKATAEHLPLAGETTGLVLMTPPYFGTRRVPRRECNTTDLAAYTTLLGRALDEAARIAKPGGYILFHSNLRSERSAGNIPVVRFDVFRRIGRGADCTIEAAGHREVRVHLEQVEGVKWQGLPVRTYEMLLRRYSRPGEIVTHVFSGTGNSALAALTLRRIPVLVDLHHHRIVRRRIHRHVRQLRA
jgi:hypothetical protein